MPHTTVKLAQAADVRHTSVNLATLWPGLAGYYRTTSSLQRGGEERVELATTPPAFLIAEGPQPWALEGISRRLGYLNYDA